MQEVIQEIAVTAANLCIYCLLTRWSKFYQLDAIHS